jgi:hypothetical protein
MATAADEILHLSWKEPDIAGSILLLRQYVESEAQRQIDWYFRKMKVKSQASTALRFVAIALFVAGGLVPILKGTLTPDTVRKLPFDFGETGYLLLGIAAGCLALDRFFGYSTGWIRYITAALAIEKSLEEFRMEWARTLAKLRGGAPNEAQLDQLILTCETFSVAIRGQVEQETKAWVAEFESSLSQLERELQASADEVKTRRRSAGSQE